MIHFRDCPAYAEKNWGAGFPDKWAWLQCNSFPSHPHLAVTAVSAVRNIFNAPGVTEEVGLIGVHHEGRFYDLGVTWGRMRWSIDPWGKWHMWAKSDKYEALVEAECDQTDGTRLRAPTPEGLQPMCKDTFKGLSIAAINCRNSKRSTLALINCSASNDYEMGKRQISNVLIGKEQAM